MLNNVSPRALAGRLRGVNAVTLDSDGAKICLALPAEASELTALVDGARGLVEICRYLVKAWHKL